MEKQLDSCNKSLFALKTMKSHGLPQSSLKNIFSATVLSKLLYASPAWQGFLSVTLRTRCDSFLKRSHRFGYFDYSSDDNNFQTLLDKLDNKLFQSIELNSKHVLHSVLPRKKNVTYSLRRMGRILPIKDDRNFMNRTMFMK